MSKKKSKRSPFKPSVNLINLSNNPTILFYNLPNDSLQQSSLPILFNSRLQSAKESEQIVPKRKAPERTIEEQEQSMIYQYNLFVVIET